jgi:hypothetical protein|tara:strand:+ start:1238 stop:2110 length:873 start_codon:yes stop_codon:yes gene_type:complete
MSYKYSKGATVQGDIKAADDSNRDTQIDFGEDSIKLDTAGATRLKISGPSGAITFNEEYAFPTADGTANQYLKTDGGGSVSWSTVSDGGGGSPAGSNTQVQYNNNGSFAGDARMTFDSSDGFLAVSGSVQVIGEEYIVPKELTTDADRQMCFTLKRQFHFSSAAANTWHDVISWRPYVAGGSSDPGSNTFWGAVSFKQEMSGHQNGVGNGYRSRVGMVQYEGSSASAASATDTTFGSPVSFQVSRSGWITTLQFNPNSGGAQAFSGMCYVEIHFARGAGGNGANIYWSVS